jgi:hypothetical protein
MYVFIYMDVYLYTYICIYVCFYTCGYTFIYVFTYIYVYIYICTLYIYTYICREDIHRLTADLENKLIVFKRNLNSEMEASCAESLERFREGRSRGKHMRIWTYMYIYECVYIFHIYVNDVLDACMYLCMYIFEMGASCAESLKRFREERSRGIIYD